MAAVACGQMTFAACMAHKHICLQAAASDRALPSTGNEVEEEAVAAEADGESRDSPVEDEVVIVIIARLLAEEISLVDLRLMWVTRLCSPPSWRR